MSTAMTGSAWDGYRRALARLAASYAAIPPGERVRLAKRTTNLFRPREASRTPGLDVTGLDDVIEIDVENRTADVGGMTTYERLVMRTLPHGLIPYVVPQLRTITLGGAVTGLGIEATSFRHGLPHESVVEMDVFTGAGELVTARAGDPLHGDLFDAFPNSYGSLGYATRLRIELEAVPPFVTLRHLRLREFDELMAAIHVAVGGDYDGLRVDAVDGVAFGPGEYYLTLATWSDEPVTASGVPMKPSDYTGQRIYYQSIRDFPEQHYSRDDVLTMHDYLWRWDTDWFWCSAAFGAQNPTLRRLWPARYRRSDVYMRLLGLDRRFHLIDTLDRLRDRPLRERVVQDVEVPLPRLAEFMAWFDEHVGMRPVWFCPLVAHRKWPCYPLEPGEVYVNVGFWGTVPVGAAARDAVVNRAIERQVTELGGHKSLYSEAFYDREAFERLYGGERLAQVKDRYDPAHRLTSLYDKAVRRR